MLEEVVDTEDGQEGVLDKIENDYNIDHRSNVHVTGTLSIVINKPHETNKIMNSNYYGHLTPQTQRP